MDLCRCTAGFPRMVPLILSPSLLGEAEGLALVVKVEGGLRGGGGGESVAVPVPAPPLTSLPSPPSSSIPTSNSSWASSFFLPSFARALCRLIHKARAMAPKTRPMVSATVKPRPMPRVASEESTATVTPPSPPIKPTGMLEGEGGGRGAITILMLDTSATAVTFMFNAAEATA